MDPYQEKREEMVKYQIEGRGITDHRVITAMRKVPRHLFLPEEAHKYAYVDSPIRIGSGQTISQPYIVAFMTELLKVQPSHRVLDVGTGSGYQAAILGELADDVHSIERHPELAESAAERLDALGYHNVHVHVGDGTQGYPPAAPYDRVIVAAAAPSVPDSLLEQLAEGGRLVLPVGSRGSQRLVVCERKKGEVSQWDSISVVFVPLIGEKGWQD